MCYASPNERVAMVENDEYQHTGINYSCEEKRIAELSEALGGLPLSVLRVNPHSYVPPAGQFYVRPKDRYPIVLRELQAIFDTSSSSRPMIEVIYFFYDQDNPVITQNLPKRFVYS